MKRMLMIMGAALLLAGCYRPSPRLLVTRGATDSIDVAIQMPAGTQRQYGVNYNFVVDADSLVLVVEQPEETMSGLPVNSIALHRHEHAVVADLRILPNDSVDSVWVQLARDQQTFGWVHEREMLRSVVPDDPISQFINTFSDTHLPFFLVVIGLIALGYLLRMLRRQGAPLVHLRDIHSFYPTLLTLIVSTAAALYASIQLFTPQAWQQFYFNPSLNPCSQTAIIAVFLCMVWAMLIVALAVIDEVRHLLHSTEAMLYLCGLFAVCAVDYIVFSITTLYFIGYLLLAAYYLFALRQLMRNEQRYNATA